MVYLRRDLQSALIELALNPEVQDRLRQELLSQHNTRDPTFDEPTHNLPYLDGVAHETLRLHLPLADLWRVVREVFFISRRATY